MRRINAAAFCSTFSVSADVFGVGIAFVSGAFVEPFEPPGESFFFGVGVSSVGESSVRGVLARGVEMSISGFCATSFFPLKMKITAPTMVKITRPKIGTSQKIAVGIEFEFDADETLWTFAGT